MTLNIEERQTMLHQLQETSLAGYIDPIGITGKRHENANDAYQKIAKWDNVNPRDEQAIDAALTKRFVDSYNAEHHTSVKVDDANGVKAAMASVKSEYDHEQGLLAAANHFRVETGKGDRSKELATMTSAEKRDFVVDFQSEYSYVAHQNGQKELKMNGNIHDKDTQEALNQYNLALLEKHPEYNQKTATPEPAVADASKTQEPSKAAKKLLSHPKADVANLEKPHHYEVNEELRGIQKAMGFTGKHADGILGKKETLAALKANNINIGQDELKFDANGIADVASVKAMLHNHQTELAALKSERDPAQTVVASDIPSKNPGIMTGKVPDLGTPAPVNVSVAKTGNDTLPPNFHDAVAKLSSADIQGMFSKVKAEFATGKSDAAADFANANRVLEEAVKNPSQREAMLKAALEGLSGHKQEGRTSEATSMPLAPQAPSVSGQNASRGA